MRLLYSEQAVADLVRLREFIADKDPSAARRIAAELVARMDNLLLFPGMGREVGEAPNPDAIRDAVFGNHVVRYSPRSDVIIVLRIWHHYEDRGNGPAREDDE